MAKFFNGGRDSVFFGQRKRESHALFPFGKYAGRPLHHAPPSYLEWFARTIPPSRVSQELMVEVRRLSMIPG